MSWSYTLGPLPAEELFKALDNAQLENVTPNGADAEVQQQFAASKEMARLAVASGALGDGVFHVGLSGHANAGHQRTPGWSLDSLYVSVYRAEVEVPPQPVPIADAAHAETLTPELLGAPADLTPKPAEPAAESTTSEPATAASEPAHTGSEGA